MPKKSKQGVNGSEASYHKVWPACYWCRLTQVPHFNSRNQRSTARSHSSSSP